MKKGIAVLLVALLVGSLVGCKVGCEHSYQPVDAVDSTCTQKGYDLYQCEHCQELNRVERADYAPHSYQRVGGEPTTCYRVGYDLYRCENCPDFYQVEHTKLAPHSYVSKAPCTRRACEVCGREEDSIIPHKMSIRDFVCVQCREKSGCSFYLLTTIYEEQMLAQAKRNAGSMIGRFEIVELDAAETAKQLENYITNPKIDSAKIKGGLFVRFDVTNGGDEVLFSIYYNFGLQMTEPQEKDIAFTYEGSDEIWYLETIEGEPTILFEFSIA